MKKLFSKLPVIATYFSVILTMIIFLFILGFILFNGIPYLTPSLFSPIYNSENVSLVPAMISTVILVCIALIIAIPFGVFSAVYLVEYARRGSKVVSMISITTETLSGIPSIIYGLFGMMFFVTYLKWGYSLLSGAFTISIMILPLIIRSSEEALKAVPDNYREASFGLGAGKLRTVFMVVLPSAIPGILTGVILSIGRIVAETAVLIYTSGTVAQIPTNVMQSARTLSVHMWLLSSEAFHINESYATAVVLVVVILFINLLSKLLTNKVRSSV